MSTMRSLKRNVARNRMKLMGFRKVNARLSANWRDLSAPDYVKRLKDKVTAMQNTKEETK